jgi:anti-sigma regulatory factor (Ser/Thr protein kinase)
MRILAIDSQEQFPADEAWACEVERLGGFADAPGRIACGNFDAVLAPWKPPGGQVREFLSSLAQTSPATPPFILGTDWKPEDAAGLLRAGAYAFLPSRTPPETILELVKGVSREWRQDIAVSSATAEWLALRAACKRESADRLGWFLRMFLADIPEGEDMLTVVRELAMNCLEHACESDPSNTVDFTCVRAGGCILCKIRDPGPGFSFTRLDHAAVSNPEGSPLDHAAVREASGLRPGGYGILMARRLADELIYSEIGNEVVAIKYRR